MMMFRATYDADMMCLIILAVPALETRTSDVFWTRTTRIMGLWWTGSESTSSDLMVRHAWIMGGIRPLD